MQLSFLHNILSCSTLVWWHIRTIGSIHCLIKLGVKWFKLGIGIGLPFWLAIMLLGGFLEGKDYVYFGGLYWQSFAYALWESFYCIAMCLGLTVLFRDKLSNKKFTYRVYV